MSLERTTALAAHNLRLILADPGPVIATTLMPVFMITFLKGMGRTALAADGVTDANGAEHVVPGMAVLFSLFGVVYLGIAFYQEHGWGTWERLRATASRPGEILLAKLAPSALVILVQSLVLFGVGVGVFDLRIRGSVAALLVLTLACTAMLTSLSMLAVAVFSSINQLSAATNVAAMLLGGIGGAIAPVSTLPGWARDLAPLSPAHWALRGYHDVIIDGGSMDAIAGPVAALTAFSIAAAAIASWRFRFTDDKRWT